LRGARRVVMSLVSLVACATEGRSAEAAPDCVEPVRRHVEERVLHSSACPALDIEVSHAFEYVGRHAFLLRESAAGERFVFVDADSSRRVERVIIAQFEGFLPGVDDAFGYDFSNAREIAGHRFRANTFAFSNGAAAEENPGGEAPLTANLLRENGYSFDDEWMMARLLTVPDDAKRNELILFYVEMASNTGLGVSDCYYQDDSGEWHESAAWKDLSLELADRLEAALEIRAPDGSP